MSSKPTTTTILLLGSYGNAGTAIAESLLLETKGSDIVLILAGRDLERAQAQAEKLKESFDRAQLRAMHVDASWPVSRLKAALELADLLVVASSTSASEANILEAALEANVHYFDLQVSTFCRFGDCLSMHRTVLLFCIQIISSCKAYSIGYFVYDSRTFVKENPT